MGRPRLLILGTGFGAYALLRRIDVRAYDVTVVSPRNHFLFTPLLPSTAVGTVEFRTIIEPIRACRPGIRFHLGRAVSLDLAHRRVVCQSVVDDTVWEQPFDRLVLAVGCVTNTFGIPGVAQHSLFLKEIEDARRIRQTLIANLERASLPGTSPEEQARLLHLAAVGGGPTGVRFAGEVYDLLCRDLHDRYPHLDGKIRVTVLDAGPSLLSAYDQSLREHVQRVFQGRGVTIRTSTRVEAVTERGLQLAGGECLPAGLVLWAAGFARNELVAGLEGEKDRAGRLLTDANLQLLNQPDVFALGDCAHPREQNLPQLAQVAEQQGRYLAASLNRRARGGMVEPFRWKPWGISSFLGGGQAVAAGDQPGAGRSGFWAWQQWRAGTWSQLPSLRSKILIPLDRFRAWLFGRDLNRL